MGDNIALCCSVICYCFTDKYDVVAVNVNVLEPHFSVVEKLKYCNIFCHLISNFLVSVFVIYKYPPASMSQKKRKNRLCLVRVTLNSHV